MVIGLGLAVAIQLAPCATGWFGPRLICACTILPVLIAAEPRVYTSAWLLMSLGARRLPGSSSSGGIERRFEPGSRGAFHSCLVWSSYLPVSSSPGIG